MTAVRLKKMALVIAMLSLTNLSTTALPVVLPLQVSYDDPIVILGNFL